MHHIIVVVNVAQGPHGPVECPGMETDWGGSVVGVGWGPTVGPYGARTLDKCPGGMSKVGR